MFGLRRFMGILAHLWKRSFVHCLVSAEAGCESSILNRLSGAKLLKSLSNAYCDGAMCVWVCLLARHRHWDRCLRRFIIVEISASGFLRVLFNDDMQRIHLHYTDWPCIPIDCVRVCRFVCLGHISMSSSTLELLFDERVIPALIESRCSLSPFNGLPVIIRSFLWV